MSINRNLADLAGDANVDGAAAVNNGAQTDLVQLSQLEAAINNFATSHNHDGQYLSVTAVLNDLTDVSAVTPADGDVLVFRDGQGWVIENSNTF